jgi:hypothetical protein
MSQKLHKAITELGKKLGFDVAAEVPASDSAYVDLVWFDPKLCPRRFGAKTRNIRFAPVLPVVGFEIEYATGSNPKHIKGSVSNLNNLGAQLGVIVIGRPTVDQYRKTRKVAATWSDQKVRETVMNMVYSWIYAESQPGGRVCLMFEEDIMSWARKEGVTVEEMA